MAGLPTGALGQDKTPIRITAREARALTVSGGIAPYDLAGTGTAAVFGVGVDLQWRLFSWWSLVLSIGVLALFVTCFQTSGGIETR